MTRRPIGTARAVALLAAALLAGCARGPERAPAIPPGEFGFLAGDWWGVFEGGCADERWTAPAAGTLMGMSRYTKAGKVEFYEFAAIEAGPNGPTLLLRHFKPGLVAWEEKDRPLAFRLVSQGPREAVFDHDDPARPARITYKRTGADELQVTVEHPGASGHTVEQFDYRRITGARNPCNIPK